MPFPCLRRIAITLALVISLMPSLSRAAPAEIAGEVVRIQGDVWLERDSRRHDLSVGDNILMGDTLATGTGARLMAILRDSTELTMGAGGRITVDALVAPLDGSVADHALIVLGGAFQVLAPPTRGAKIITPVATIGIRGTEFWGGSLDAALDFLLFEGAVEVGNAHGRTLLEASMVGLSVTSADTAPGRPMVWPADKVIRATAMVAFTE